MTFGGFSIQIEENLSISRSFNNFLLQKNYYTRKTYKELKLNYLNYKTLQIQDL